MEKLEKELAETEKTPPPAEHISWARRVLYLLNHALSCFVTDMFVQTPVSSLAQKYLPQSGKFFETHAHHEHHGHELEHFVHVTPKESFINNSKHWIIGEAAGDLGAVPITATMQHYMPKLMSPIRKGVEPFVGWYFRKGAVKDAKKWASEQKLNPEGPEAEAKAKEFYEYELSHMGPVVVWNILSASINIYVQKAFLKVPDSWQTLAAAKGFSTIFSNGILLSARASFPRTFEEMEYKGERLFHKAAGSKPEIEVHTKGPDAPPEEKDKPKWTERSSQATQAETAR